MPSKFAAWASEWREDSHGIRLQISGYEPHQKRSTLGYKIRAEYFPGPGFDVSVSSTNTASPDWPKEHIVDEIDSTVWCSKWNGSPDAREWFAFWFGKRKINYLELLPRRVNGKAVAFPTELEIKYSAGVNDWRALTTVSIADPDSIDPINGPDKEGLNPAHPGSIHIPLDRFGAIETDGLLVHALGLRQDNTNTNSYYFQLAGARASYRSLNFDSSSVTKLSSDHPDASFYLGDEPDQHVPADEHARAYDAFYRAVKCGNPQAKGLVVISSGLEYAKAFLKTATSLVDEWRFHVFYGPEQSYTDWETRIKEISAWCKQHNSTLGIGSFGCPNIPNDVPMLKYQRQAMQLIKQDDNIVDAVWWRYAPRPDGLGGTQETHGLADQVTNQLTPDGELFVELM